MTIAKLICKTKTDTNLNEYFYVNSKDGIYTINDLSFEYGKTLETQGTTGNKPVSYITALKLINSGFKIHLDHRFVDIQKKEAKWRDMAENNYVYNFYVGAYKIGKNPFVIESVKVSNIRINGQGVVLSEDLDISLQEYAGGKSTIGILRKRLADYSEDGTTVSWTM